VSSSPGFNLEFGFAFFVEIDQYQKSNIKNKNDKLKGKSQVSPNDKRNPLTLTLTLTLSHQGRED